VQFSLGLAHKDGSGVPINMQEAVRWFHKAAVQGYARAQHNMGVAYGQGVGVSADPAEAVRWLRKAGEQGLALSQHNRGGGCRWMCSWVSIGYARLPSRDTLNLKLPSRSLRQLASSRAILTQAVSTIRSARRCGEFIKEET